MALITWKENLETGNREIDNQHKKIVELINQLFDSMTENRGEEKLSIIFKELTSYAVQHFATEEKYMQLYKFNEFAEHKKEHEDFVKKVGELKAGFDKGERMTVNVLNFMKSWLLNHIMNTDKKYVPMLKTNGLA